MQQVCFYIFKSDLFINLGSSGFLSTPQAEVKPKAEEVAEQSDSSDDSDLEKGFISVTNKKKKRKLGASKEVETKKAKVEAPLILDSSDAEESETIEVKRVAKK